VRFRIGRREGRKPTAKELGIAAPPLLANAGGCAQRGKVLDVSATRTRRKPAAPEMQNAGRSERGHRREGEEARKQWMTADRLFFRRSGHPGCLGPGN